MITIDKIDFSKLKPYDGKVTKCFEQLCYQIAQREYGHLGTFTAIDGSGGDGGVEFYLNLRNGEKWGWQCKFFNDTGRLSVSNRKSQIEISLETACRNHTDLNKWILCLKTDLTEDSIDRNGKTTKGEQHWFKTELPNKIPSRKTTELEHWGESKILSLLNSPKQIGIRGFFFGDMEFTNEWFKSKFKENFEKVKDKYDPELHSIDKYTQSIIDFTLLDSNYCKLLENLKESLEAKYCEYLSAINSFRDEKLISKEEELQRENYISICEKFGKHKIYVDDVIDYLITCFKNQSEDFLSYRILEKLEIDFVAFFLKIDFAVFEHKEKTYREASEIYNLISEFASIYNQFFRNYFHEKQKEIHFIADAAKGKTHVSCDIAYKNIEADKPAIFITGDKFTNETSITESIKKILDINQEYSFDEFLQALDIFGSIVKIRIPIIIDGLNETTDNRFFSPIWKTHLSSFISKIASTNNVIVITTCRSSYTKRIWENIYERKFHYLDGFDDHETVHKAVNKYFKKFKLKADLFFASVEKFKDPIFLKIFCEIKNPNWETSNVVEVNIEEETTSDVFNEYLKQVNNRVTANSHLFRTNEPFIKKSLGILGKYLWENRSREIDVLTFYKLIDGEKEFQKDTLKADILIQEGLVISRDTRDENEFISFTYQILSGYIIAEFLINNNSADYFISKEFIDKLFSEDSQHPLFDDVIEALCVLLPQLKEISLHEILNYNTLEDFKKQNYTNGVKFYEYSFSKSITSLFSLSSKYIKKSDKNIVAKLFSDFPENRKMFFDLSFKTLSDIKHPLNALFISRLLFSLEMNQRDTSWTEYIRKKAIDLISFISEFETQCKHLDEEPLIITQKQHLLANIILWFLTSTNRILRDSATQALYYYGRKFPVEFSSLVYNSLKINDPYVWERCLGCLYGVAMAKHNELKDTKFRIEILPEIGKNIYSLIFAKSALYSTTHILARDYARRIIEVSLIHHPDLLSPNEINHIRPPYTFGGLRNLGEHDYGQDDPSYSGPIRMDFNNYTLGHLVKDGHSYSNPPEKIKVRKQIYWRIYNLGWNEDFFNEAETALSNANYYTGGRTERARVERYGKKYSWIAYFENAGLRSDLGLIENDWEDFRISDADIDPSFPKAPENELFISDDLLGDRNTPLIDWYEKGGLPLVDEYLSITNSNGLIGEWACLDGFINQEDFPAERERFTFIRSLLLKEEDYSEAIVLLKKQHLGGRWISEKRENYYTYAGELYYCNDSTQKNNAVLEFIISKKKVKIKKGESGYYPSVSLEDENGQLKIKKEFPEEIEKEVSETKEFDILFPVMEYNWEGYHSHLNGAGGTTVVAKEIASHLGLVDQPQTFELYETNGNKASLNISYHNGHDNRHSFVYLRKDLLNKFLKENKLKMVWAIWGERDVTFKTDERRKEFFTTHPFKEHQVFQKIIEYTIE